MDSNEDSGEQDIQPNESWFSTNAEIASQVISKYTGATSSSSKRKQTNTKPSDEEYSRKRARNNVAVKKSREKAKNRIVETQVRVEQLSQENEELQTKVTLLTKELNVLRALFTNGGFALPGELQIVTSNSNNELSSTNQHQSAEQTSSNVGNPHLSTIKNAKTSFDTKIQPLKPLPRAFASSQKSMITSPQQNSDNFNSHDRSSEPQLYTYNPKYSPVTEYVKKEPKKTSCHSMSVLLPQDLTTTQRNSSLLYQHNAEPRHTSVIQTNTSEINSPKSSLSQNSLTQNSLGKFCIIQDPEKAGQVKIVPLDS